MNLIYQCVHIFIDRDEYSQINSSSAIFSFCSKVQLYFVKQHSGFAGKCYLKFEKMEVIHSLYSALKIVGY